MSPAEKAASEADLQAILARGKLLAMTAGVLFAGLAGYNIISADDCMHAQPRATDAQEIPPPAARTPSLPVAISTTGSTSDSWVWWP